MPVQVSLLELVSVPDTRPLWPVAFEAFVKQCEASPDERTHFGACADWLDESEQAEHLLAKAFRYVAKRPEVRITRSGSTWFVDELPSSVRWTVYSCRKTDHHTLAGVLAELAYRLKKAMEELE